MSHKYLKASREIHNTIIYQQKKTNEQRQLYSRGDLHLSLFSRTRHKY